MAVVRFMSVFVGCLLGWCLCGVHHHAHPGGPHKHIFSTAILVPAFPPRSQSSRTRSLRPSDLIAILPGRRQATQADWQQQADWATPGSRLLAGDDRGTGGTGVEHGRRWGDFGRIDDAGTCVLVARMTITHLRTCAYARRPHAHPRPRPRATRAFLFLPRSEKSV
jgi:hypothetical protein